MPAVTEMHNVIGDPGGESPLHHVTHVDRTPSTVERMNYLNRPDLLIGLEDCDADKKFYVKNIPEAVEMSSDVTSEESPQCNRRAAPDVTTHPAARNQVTAGSSTTTKKRKHILKTARRVACCMGWVFFCPCWTLGVCLREPPESLDDLRMDPCWPCFTKTTPPADL